MKTRTAMLVIWLSATSMTIGWAQTVVNDRAGNQYTCRKDDDKGIYTRWNGTPYHLYDIQAAKDNGEAEHGPNHDSLCIDALGLQEIIWSWKGATDIQVSFTPLTDDTKKGDGTCWKSHQPFLNDPKAKSGKYDFLRSGRGDNDHSGCAYKMTFTNAGGGKHDPHIIINGSHNDTSTELQQVKDELVAVQQQIEEQLKKVDALLLEKK